MRGHPSSMSHVIPSSPLPDLQGPGRGPSGELQAVAVGGLRRAGGRRPGGETAGGRGAAPKREETTRNDDRERERTIDHPSSQLFQ